MYPHKFNIYPRDNDWQMYISSPFDNSTPSFIQLSQDFYTWMSSNHHLMFNWYKPNLLIFPPTSFSHSTPQLNKLQLHPSSF